LERIYGFRESAIFLSTKLPSIHETPTLADTIES